MFHESVFDERKMLAKNLKGSDKDKLNKWV